MLFQFKCRYCPALFSDRSAFCFFISGLLESFTIVLLCQKQLNYAACVEFQIEMMPIVYWSVDIVQFEYVAAFESLQLLFLFPLEGI